MRIGYQSINIFVPLFVFIDYFNYGRSKGRKGDFYPVLLSHCITVFESSLTWYSPVCPVQNFVVKADDLEQIDELGRGAYGVVDKMRHMPSGLIMAVKVCEI